VYAFRGVPRRRRASSDKSVEPLTTAHWARLNQILPGRSGFLIRLYRYQLPASILVRAITVPAGYGEAFGDFFREDGELVRIVDSCVAEKDLTRAAFRIALYSPVDVFHSVPTP
jgi:hypothetical protein